MPRQLSLPTTVFLFLFLFCASLIFSQINASKEFLNVFHSPAADSPRPPFRSIFQMELIVKKNGATDAEVQYVNGTVVSADGHIVTVLDEPFPNQAASGGIESAAILLLDGRSAEAKFVAYVPEYGVGIFRVQGLKLPHLRLSKATPVANRQMTWHAVFRDGRKTFLYTRPLRVHKANFQIAETKDLYRISRKEDGMKVRIFSPYSFRSELRPKDAFEHQTLEELSAILSQEPAGTRPLEHYEFVSTGNRPFLRYARGQVMKDSCIDCHNTHKDTPKTDWKAGDLAGVLTLTRPLDRDVARTRTGFRGASLLMASIVSLLAVIGVGFAYKTRSAIRG